MDEGEDLAWLEGSDNGDDEDARGEMLTKTRLGVLTGMSNPTISKLVAEGAPVVIGATKREGWRINSVKFFRWWRRYLQQQMLTDPDASGLEIAQLRDKEAQTRLRELQIAQREGSLIPVDTVVAFVGKKFGDARSRMLAVRSQVVGLTDEQKEQLDAAIRDAMEDVSGDQMEDWINGAASAESDSESS